MTDETLNNYVLKLSLPIQAPSLAAAAEIFLDEARSGTWAYTVDTPEGRSMADIAVEDGKVKSITPIAAVTGLYYVTGDLKDDGTDVSSVVEATSPEEAVKLWIANWKEQTGEEPEMRDVFRLPERTGESGVFGWFTKELPSVMNGD